MKLKSKIIFHTENIQIFCVILLVYTTYSNMMLFILFKIINRFQKAKKLVLKYIHICLINKRQISTLGFLQDKYFTLSSKDFGCTFFGGMV